MFKHYLAAAGLIGGMLAPAATATAASAAPAPDHRSVASGYGAVSIQDVDFLMGVHRANLAEIAGGRIAEKRGGDPRVRALGARFVADHTKIDAALAKVAGELHVSLPAEPTDAQQTLGERYATVPVSAFDKLYLTTQLTAHEEAMSAGKLELAKGENRKVKKLVVSAGPIVMSHHAAILATEKALAVTTAAHHPGHHG